MQQKYADLLVRGGRSDNFFKDLSVPGDKSITHRAILAGLLTQDDLEICGANTGDAVRALIAPFRELGLEIIETMSLLRVRRVEERSPLARLDVGGSSAAGRLLLGMMAGFGWSAVIDGDAVLRRRPMAWLVDPLRMLGARIDYLGAEGCLPVRVSGGVDRGGALELKIGSAQARAGVLLAAVAAQVPITLRYPVLSRDHTERMLTSFGADLDWNDRELSYRPGPLQVPDVIEIPGDPSLAAYPAAAQVLWAAPDPMRLDRICLNPSRLGFFETLRRAGARIHYTDRLELHGEPVGTIVIEGGRHELRPLVVDDPFTLHALIDEVPLLSAVAATVPGDSRIGSAGELSFKESNRLTTTVDMLRPFGVAIDADDAAIHVHGGRPLHAADTNSHRDHRIAMSAATLAMGLTGQSRIRAGRSHRTSFPEFAEQMIEAGAQLSWDAESERAPQNDVVLRQLRESDYHEVIEQLESWWDGRPVTAMLPRLFFRHFAGTSVVAERSGRVVGFLVGIISATQPAEAHVHFAGVAPAVRGQQIGRRLYQRFLELARERGCELVTAVTSTGNTDSQAFHRAVGFTALITPDGEQCWPSWDGPGHDRIRFQLGLT